MKKNIIAILVVLVLLGFPAGVVSADAWHSAETNYQIPGNATRGQYFYTAGDTGTEEVGNVSINTSSSSVSVAYIQCYDKNFDFDRGLYNPSLSGSNYVIDLTGKGCEVIIIGFANNSSETQFINPYGDIEVKLISTNNSGGQRDFSSVMADTTSVITPYSPFVLSGLVFGLAGKLIFTLKRVGA